MVLWFEFKTCASMKTLVKYNLHLQILKTLYGPWWRKVQYAVKSWDAHLLNITSNLSGTKSGSYVNTTSKLWQALMKDFVLLHCFTTWVANRSIIQQNVSPNYSLNSIFSLFPSSKVLIVTNNWLPYHHLLDAFGSHSCGLWYLIVVFALVKLFVS